MAGDFGEFAAGLKGVGTLPADNAATQPFSAFAAGLPKAAPAPAGTDALARAATGDPAGFASTEGGAAAGRTLRPVKGAGKGSLERLGASGLGAIGQAVDMSLSALPAVATLPRRWYVANLAQFQHEKPEVVAQAAELAGDVLPPEVTTPFRTIAERLGPEAQKAYQDNPFGWISEIMSKGVEPGAKNIEKRTGIPAWATSMALNDAMNLMVAGGLKGSLQAEWNGLDAAAKAKFTEDFMARQRGPKPRLKGPAAEAVPVGEKPRIKGPAATAEPVVEMRPSAAAFGKAAAAAAAGVAGYELGSHMDQDQLAALGGAAAVFIPAMKGTALDKAMDLRRRGFSEETIWRETGMFQHGKTGNWLQELSDREIKFRRNLELADVAQPGVRFALNEFLDHPELKKLPEPIQQKLQKVLVERLKSDKLAGEVGHEADLHSPEIQRVVMRLVPDRFVPMLRTAVHELQHTLDMAYRNPRGGSVEEFLPRDWEKRHQQATNVAETQVLEEQYAAARAKYDRLVGENLAVAAERRMHLTETERRARTPWQDMPTQMKDQIVRLGLGIQSAVKEKGGMWHPEAVARLVEPLFRRLSVEHTGFNLEDLRMGEGQGEPWYKDALAKAEWSQRAIRTYLNRYAGTAADPLKDVRIPMLGNTARWEEVTDQAINKAGFSGPKGFEFQYNIDRIPQETGALQSYLYHVGDYLREHVPADQLQRYDLVRAVRETAAQDARQAAKMAKARATGAGTVLHKDYGDGMKWVEVGVPAKEGVPAGYEIRQVKGLGVPDYQVWKDGKEIDGGTGQPVNYASVANAEAAARQHVADAALKAEGDVMGHCVGGYCEMVHEGQSRIYSLRDKEGMSHVTVEVAPEGQGVNRWTPEGEADSTLPSIVQIKGKQNRAPVAKYLPYVQDFVKSGKWGEVGDLENAGLNRSQDGRYLTREEMNADGQPYFDEHGVAHYRPPGQRGSADPRTLAAIAAAGVGAAVGSQIDPNHPWLGGALGALSGAAATRFVPMAARGLLDATRAVLSPGSPYERLKAAGKELVPAPIASAFAKDSRIRIKEQMDAAEVFERKQGLVASRDIIRVMELAPKEAERAQVAHAIETNAVGGLPPKLQQAARQAQGMFDRLGQLGLAAGTVKDLLDHYVTHVFGREALPFLDELMRDRNIGSATSPFGKTRRGPPTISEVNAWMAKKGQPPITADIAKIMTAYSNSMIKAIANRQLINTLKLTSAPAIKNGQTIQRAVVTTKPIGNYVPLGRYNLYVHPDILPALRFAFEQDNVPGLLRGIEGVNTALKRTAVSFSLFHAKSLVDAMAGGAKLSKKSMMIGALGGVAYATATDNDPITYAMIGIGLGMAAPGLKLAAQAAAPKLFGENRYVKALRQNDPALAKMIDLSFEGGLQYSLKGGTLAVEEASKGFYEGLEFARKGLDNLVPGSGKLVKGVEVANQAMDTFMWDRLHTAMKLEVFAKTYETMLENNVKANGRNPKIALMTEKQVAEAAASYTNDIFGGLNWRRIAEEGFTRWGRDIKMGVYRPGGRRILRLAMFAPDWTISTTRAALKAFGGVVGQPEGGGLRGLVQPRTAADFHRQYMIRSAFYYAMIGDGINYAMTGHHLWQNKDPTYIELGDGRRMQFSKHTMEPYHWMMHPVQQGLNKLGQVPKEALNQMLGTEYLNPRATTQGQIYAGPAMKSGRLAHLGSQLSPIGVQQFAEGPAGGVLGAVGMPIYGKKTVDVAAEKAAKARQRTRDKKRTGR